MSGTMPPELGRQSKSQLMALRVMGPWLMALGVMGPWLKAL